MSEPTNEGQLSDEELKAALVAEGREDCQVCHCPKARDNEDDDDARLDGRLFHLCETDLGGLHGNAFILAE